MEWYWWVLIGVGVVLIGWLKLTVLKKWMAKRKEQDQPMEDDE
jgi:hypothetical protein